MLILATLIVYFAALLLISRLTHGKGERNEAFFRANRRSPWPMVAFGMIGASISGVTFVSVPGMVIRSDMTYLQMCLGFIFGYFAVAFLLLPVYYRMGSPSIYTYLGRRFGRRAYKTGSSFFLLSKMAGAAVRFYVVCMILQRYVVSDRLPFALTVVIMVALIWVYTRQSGVKTLVWTDTFQTFCLFLALLLIIYMVTRRLGLGIGEAVSAVAASDKSRIFVFDDWMSRQNFWKQFLSGIFVVIVMTGLDQDMMQKNLTCKTLREAQKDMCSYGLAFVPANLLFLALGVLLLMLGETPQTPDELLPMWAATGRLGDAAVALFTIGIVAASFSSADSALTALTTSFCIDIRERPDDERLRRRAHLGICTVFALLIVAFQAVNSTSVIDAIYILCSYTYGPLLGLFAYGLLTRRRIDDRWSPYVAIASPVLCLLISFVTEWQTGYKFGYELLMLNGALTFLGLYLSSLRK